eukprot:SAG31_NODE_9676_length_1243_cov_1.208916_1_plen_52_part_10
MFKIITKACVRALQVDIESTRATLANVSEQESLTAASQGLNVDMTGTSNTVD